MKLAALERGNLFLVPPDDRRRWYRYHHLFADVLHAHLLEEQPDDLPELHRRASAWFEHNDEPHEAIRHAMAGRDFDRAADLVELMVPAMRRTRQVATLRRWLEAFPDQLVRVRPVLSLPNQSDGTTLIHGQVADQAALHGLLQKVRDVGLPLGLVSLTKVDPDRPDAPAITPR